MADNPNFPVATAAVNWIDSSGNLHIRVYSSDGYNVIERCTDTGTNGWTTGSFSQPGSQVSATAWQTSNGAYIRVYCTGNDTTTEWCMDPGGNWYQGQYTTS
ncbi:MAG: hypothetical protein KF730_02480 [Sphingomonas sp.]|uniref:hypothetical protein n=1 Tax=Sphingomonas sp. TaxID=28214 RepID=UPI0025F655F5|nr:hypothetical protein [Sphingomonas sp.]MBX3563422.1 hypothetical protein [Sphingomonas sp.]